MFKRKLPSVLKIKVGTRLTADANLGNGFGYETHTAYFRDMRTHDLLMKHSIEYAEWLMQTESGTAENAVSQLMRKLEVFLKLSADTLSKDKYKALVEEIISLNEGMPEHPGSDDNLFSFTLHDVHMDISVINKRNAAKGAGTIRDHILRMSIKDRKCQ